MAFDDPILKLFAPPLLSALVAFLLFYLTTKRDLGKEQSKRRKERNNRARYISNLIVDCIKSLEKQHDAINLHVDETHQQPFIYHPITLFINSNLTRLVKVLGEELSFVSIIKLKSKKILEDRIELFNQLVAKVDYIDSLLNNVIEMAKNRLEHNLKEYSLIQLATDGILANTSVTMIELQKGAMTDLDKEYVATMEAIDKRLKSVVEQSVINYYTYLVTPAKATVPKFMKTTFSKIDYLQEVIKSIEESDRLYNQMVGNSHMYGNDMREMAIELRKALDSLHHISDSIMNLINKKSKIPAIHSSRDMV